MNHVFLQPAAIVLKNKKSMNGFKKGKAVLFVKLRLQLRQLNSIINSNKLSINISALKITLKMKTRHKRNDSINFSIFVTKKINFYFLYLITLLFFI